ncbi:hypothetical protein J7E93_17000 [Streptomyces sp. ISL-36]|uniref:hypothetical protein n=1 Tax=Streptomyces sp. ISL-36 TaxID=2819182 RepID=UPI001BE60D4B|nr:hypothetical protein [Streptomyces sp. ISL-36]MBT2441780.1 hypothetical protein [Streptomyces sp. ISL-36]
MRKIICLSAALALPLALAAAGPAAADTSSCTHHFSGPQICIRLDGNNGWNSVTGIWRNPPKGLKSKAVTLYWNGEKFDTATARRVGKTLSYTWSNMQTGTDTKLCVRFKGSERMACDKTKYIGNRANF